MQEFTDGNAEGIHQARLVEHVVGHATQASVGKHVVQVEHWIVPQIGHVQQAVRVKLVQIVAHAIDHVVTLHVELWHQRWWGGHEGPLGHLRHSTVVGWQWFAIRASLGRLFGFRWAVTFVRVASMSNGGMDSTVGRGSIVHGQFTATGRVVIAVVVRGQVAQVRGAGGQWGQLGLAGR